MENMTIEKKQGLDVPKKVKKNKVIRVILTEYMVNSRFRRINPMIDPEKPFQVAHLTH